MKITKKQLIKIIREEIAHAPSIDLLKEEPSRNIETVGDLKALIKTATSKKKADQGKSAFKDLASGLLADVIPGGGTVKGMFDAVKSMYSLPDEKRTGTALDYMDVDDDVSAIVDDNIENAFIKAMSSKLETMSDDKPLSDVNMTKQLSKFISRKFNNRTVSGFTESRLRKNMRVTKTQLREMIREVIEEDVRKRGNQYCAYVDDKVTKKDKENNPKLYKGKKAGSVKKTKSGKIKMKARACYASKKKANNAMAAAMM